MPRLSRLAGVAGGLLIAGGSVAGALASSHREAPLTSMDPEVDSTDLYAFVDPHDATKLDLIANYVPMEDPAGGPNFWVFDPTVRYAIHVDNNGDGVPDVTYEFAFTTILQSGDTFLYASGPVTSLNDPNQVVRQSYTVTEVRGTTRTVIGSNILTVPANVGPRSDPSFGTLEGLGVASLTGGIRSFAGQADDPFFVDLGSIFDLGGLRPFNPLHLIPGSTAPGIDDLMGLNVQTMALQVPIARLTRDGKTHKAADAAATIGVWTAAYRQAVTVRSTTGTIKTSGPFVQVSRLGNPLVNEVIIPRGMKDYWNSQPPSKDSRFVQFYEKPELAALINLLYVNTHSPIQKVDTTGRTDLSLILLHGIPTVNNTGAVAADELRVNTGIPACTADPATDNLGACRELGVFPTDPKATAGSFTADLQAFPNGRRLGDDIVDIELRAIAQGYGPVLEKLFKLPNKAPNNIVGDGVDGNDHAFLSDFPYIALANQGYSHEHHHKGMLPL